MFSEIVRVAAPGATIAFTLPTASSFGEFFSIYWEALHNTAYRSRIRRRTVDHTSFQRSQTSSS
jgi:hypothetical protein